MFESLQFEKTSISKRFVDHMKDLIVQGQLSSGEKLPSEREMSQKMNISRNTVREAYKILATLGYVEVKHGQGVFVANENSSIDQWAATFFIRNDQIFELFEIRRLLETQSVKRAAERATEEQIEELRGLIYLPGSQNEPDHRELGDNDQKFHLFLAEISGNSILIRIMHNLIGLLKESREKAMQIPGRVLQSLNEHKELVNSIAEHDPVLAEKCMLNHLDSVEKSFTENMKNSKDSMR